MKTLTMPPAVPPPPPPPRGAYSATPTLYPRRLHPKNPYSLIATLYFLVVAISTHRGILVAAFLIQALLSESTGTEDSED